MRTPKRDLLVLLNEELMSPQALEHEMDALNAILFKAECYENILTAHELIDLNRYKIYSQRHILLRELRSRKATPFIFFFNKN
jgi:hypothetical protein